MSVIYHYSSLIWNISRLILRLFLVLEQLVEQVLLPVGLGQSVEPFGVPLVELPIRFLSLLGHLHKSPVRTKSMRKQKIWSETYWLI